MSKRQYDTTVAVLLAEGGSLLHGEHWIARFSEEIDINPETLRRMISGRMAVPSAVALRALPLIRKRIAELEAVAKRIEATQQPEADKPALSRSPKKRSAPKRD